METQNYIVLRSRGASVPVMSSLGEPPVAFRGFTLQPDILQLSEVELSKAERDDIRRDPSIKAVAPPMPMKLIEPFAAGAEIVDSVVDGVAWGVSAVGAIKSAYDGEGITVAVLDTGIDPDHSSFAGVNVIRKNFTKEVDEDIHGHGTHCAGTIFGRDVDGIRIGVARGVNRAVIGKVLGTGGGSSANIASAIQWAVNEGAHVISMSLGIDFPGFVEYLTNTQGFAVKPATSMALEAYRANVNLFNQVAGHLSAMGAFTQGAIVVAASGNESNRPGYEIAVGPPAAATGIIAVGALGQESGGLKVADFSNTQVNISAPGVNVFSAKLGGGLIAMSGTSMATPHAAGVAVLHAQKMLQMTGRVDALTVTSNLIASGDYAPILTGYRDYEDVGAGIVQSP